MSLRRIFCSLSKWVNKTTAGFIVGLLSLSCASASYAGPGAEAYNEFLEKEIIYPDEEWQAYVTEVGERLLAKSAHKNRNYTFVVTDQPLVNAWATPDAYIFLTRGIIAHFNSEDEMAAVLGHEIGHVI
ncbi:MAG: M48 family metalloprotease, partial [Gammaproteobacteria bacterium]|nr:M48 family metalloprotease [Gammaproteobacteria bacterium]